MVPIFVLALLRVLPVVHFVICRGDGALRVPPPSSLSRRRVRGQQPRRDRSQCWLCTSCLSGETQAALQNVYERSAEGVLRTRKAEAHSFRAAARRERHLFEGAGFELFFVARLFARLRASLGRKQATLEPEHEWLRGAAWVSVILTLGCSPAREVGYRYLLGI